MRDDGYTLVEMLGALLVLSLVFVGLSAVARLAGRGIADVQHHRAVFADVRKVDQILALATAAMTEDGHSIAGQGGSETELRWLCGDTRCALFTDGGDLVFQRDETGRRAHLKTINTPHILYLASGETALSNTWSGEQPLRLVAVEGAIANRPILLAASEITRHAEPDCVFDAIDMRCTRQIRSQP